MKIMKGDIGRTKKMSFPIHVMTLMNLVFLFVREGFGNVSYIIPVLQFLFVMRQS